MDIEYCIEASVLWNQIIKAIKGSRKELKISYNEEGGYVEVEVDGFRIPMFYPITIDHLEEIASRAL